MAQQQEESDYIRRLRGIQQAHVVDQDGVYGKAQAELELAMAKQPGPGHFLVCKELDEGTRRYVCKCFARDGLFAELYVDWYMYYNGDERNTPCVRVTVPDLLVKSVV